MKGATVTLAVSGKVFEWDPDFPNLLEFIESLGIQPPFSCRAGICGTCLQMVTGQVRYVEEPLEMPAEGTALLCCGVPDGDVVLEL